MKEVHSLNGLSSGKFFLKITTLQQGTITTVKEYYLED